ncbi:MAG: hypothetical protein ACR2K6_06035 [Solirubrobacterales bacterium]
MHAAFGYMHWLAATAVDRVRSQSGQGTVEYVGLILMVAVLMGGMITAIGGLNSLPGKELAEAITGKIVSSVKKITFGS